MNLLEEIYGVDSEHLKKLQLRIAGFRLDPSIEASLKQTVDQFEQMRVNFLSSSVVADMVKSMNEANERFREMCLPKFEALDYSALNQMLNNWKAMTEPRFDLDFGHITRHHAKPKLEPEPEPEPVIKRKVIRGFAPEE